METLCRIDKSELAKVPTQGPLIVYSNHTGSVEVPILYTELQPRPVTGMAKIETWDDRFLCWLFNLWEAIPIRRGEVDMSAMRRSLEVLSRGHILAMAPEGTRNKTGQLQRAHPGIVTLALHSGAPLLPLAHWGGEEFLNNLKRVKRTDFHIRIGKPFKISPVGLRMTKETRQQIVDEMMYRLAALLPEEYRGRYSDLTHTTLKYLQDLEM